MVAENHKNKSGQVAEPVKIFKLQFPFAYGDTQITECKFMRRPKAKDIKGLKLSDQLADDQYILLGRITDLSTPVIEEMDMADAMSLIKELTDFLPESLRTGKIS